MDFRFSAADQALREEATDFVRREWQNPGVDLTGGLAGWHGNEEERAYGHELTTGFAKKLVDIRAGTRCIGRRSTAVRRLQLRRSWRTAR